MAINPTNGFVASHQPGVEPVVYNLTAPNEVALKAMIADITAAHPGCTVTQSDPSVPAMAGFVGAKLTVAKA